MRENIKLLSEYRNHAIHYYNEKDFGVVIHTLAQTAILNYRDLSKAAFNISLDEEINWQVMPIGVRPSVDVVQYISGKSRAKMTGAVRQFLSELVRSLNAVENAGLEMSKLLTVFSVKLESVKKSELADVVVGVTQAECRENPLAIVRTQDPNKTHPLRLKDVVERVQRLGEHELTQYTFLAIAWKFELKEDPRLCWKSSEEGLLTRYSNEIIQYLRNLTPREIESALDGYKEHNREIRRLKRLGKAE